LRIKTGIRRHLSDHETRDIGRLQFWPYVRGSEAGILSVKHAPSVCRSDAINRDGIHLYLLTASATKIINVQSQFATLIQAML
jgi:hypothetical protein